MKRELPDEAQPAGKRERLTLLIDHWAECASREVPPVLLRLVERPVEVGSWHAFYKKYKFVEKTGVPGFDYNLNCLAGNRMKTDDSVEAYLDLIRHVRKHQENPKTNLAQVRDPVSPLYFDIDFKSSEFYLDFLRGLGDADSFVEHLLRFSREVIGSFRSDLQLHCLVMTSNGPSGAAKKSSMRLIWPGVWLDMSQMSLVTRMVAARLVAACGAERFMGVAIQGDLIDFAPLTTENACTRVPYASKTFNQRCAACESLAGKSKKMTKFCPNLTGEGKRCVQVSERRYMLPSAFINPSGEPQWEVDWEVFIIGSSVRNLRGVMDHPLPWKDSFRFQYEQVAAAWEGPKQKRRKKQLTARVQRETTHAFDKRWLQTLNAVAGPTVLAEDLVGVSTLSLEQRQFATGTPHVRSGENVTFSQDHIDTGDWEEALRLRCKAALGDGFSLDKMNVEETKYGPRIRTYVSGAICPIKRDVHRSNRMSLCCDLRSVAVFCLDPTCKSTATCVPHAKIVGDNSTWMKRCLP